MTKKRDGVTVVIGDDFVDETPRRVSRRIRSEVSSRLESKDVSVITRGDREFTLKRGEGGAITVTCKTCSKSAPASSDTLAAFVEAHDHPELRPPPALEPAPGLEQLLGKVRALAELKGDGDELEVLSIIVDRLAGGLKVYGKLHIDSDERDFEQEALEEAADGSIYSAIGIIRRRRKARGK